MKVKRIGQISAYVFDDANVLRGWVFADTPGWRWSPMLPGEPRGPLRVTLDEALGDAEAALAAQVAE